MESLKKRLETGTWMGTEVEQDGGDVPRAVVLQLTYSLFKYFEQADTHSRTKAKKIETCKYIVLYIVQYNVQCTQSKLTACRYCTAQRTDA